jgi:hypothetical protein
VPDAIVTAVLLLSYDNLKNDLMKLKINLTGACSLLLGALSIGTFIGCQPDKAGDGNGLVAEELTPSFTVTPVAGKNNTYVLKADEKGVLALKWNKGDGGDPALGKAIDTVFYPDAGKYNISLIAIGKGGVSHEAMQELTVAVSDPIAGNLVVGGRMKPEDASKWTALKISDGVNFAISNGKMVATGGGWGHAGIYQAVEVIGGKKYKVDMNISGGGASDCWYEVYVGTDVPVQGKDYASGGTRLALNTWSGCGSSSFSGKLSSISCAGTGGGVVTLANSGTVYLCIRSGGANLGTAGISITNVEMRGTK